MKYYLPRAFVFPLNLKLCWNKVLICILVLSNILIPVTLPHVFISITILSVFTEVFFLEGGGHCSGLHCGAQALP